MTNETPQREMPFVLSFFLSFVVSAVTTLAICEITPGEPLAMDLGHSKARLPNKPV